MQVSNQGTVEVLHFAARLGLPHAHGNEATIFFIELQVLLLMHAAAAMPMERASEHHFPSPMLALLTVSAMNIRTCFTNYAQLLGSYCG